MTRPLALAQLTALPLDPPRLVALAAAIGVQGVGIRLWPTAPGTVVYDLVNDHALRRETLAALRDTSVRVLDVEVHRIGPDYVLADRMATVAVCGELGAAHINVVCDDPDHARLADRYAALCDAAAPYGLTCDLEFMPWTALKNLAQARAVLEAVDRPNAGLIIDMLHFTRAGCRLDELDALPPRWLHWAQVCDGPIPGPDTEAGLIHAARCERLLPGEGDIDLAAIVRRLPAHLPLSIEVPSDTRAPRMGYEAWARRALAATRALLEALPG